MPLKIIFILFCIFTSIKNDLKVDFSSQEIVQQSESVNSKIEVNEKADKLSKITTLLSVAIIGTFFLLTLALLKNINFRAKANKLLQEKNEELTAAKEKAEKANQARAEFLSTITHELRTPLYAVTGLTYLLLEDNPSPDQKEHLSSLRFSGEYLLSLINNILDLNKLEAEKVKVEKLAFNLEKKISEVYKTLQKSAVKNNNEINFVFDPDIPQKLINDPLKISQILINLLSNAIKFTENGKIDLKVTKIGENENNVKILFEVEDDGLGITKEGQKVIFNTFSQESLKINRLYGGTGLGLAIVKKLLELLDSEINLESEVGVGSKFSFELDFDICKEKTESNNSNNDYTNFVEKLKHKKALVVEDNKLNQMITCKILNKEGITTNTADDGKTAIKKCHENEYDFILMDIHMPGISGIEASHEIRKFNKKTPIIALTAVTLSDQLDQFYDNGINDIIPKPYKINDFFNIIENTFDSFN